MSAVLTLDLRPGDVIHHPGRYPETIARVVYDPSTDGVVATLHFTNGGWIWSGIKALHDPVDLANPHPET